MVTITLLFLQRSSKLMWENKRVISQLEIRKPKPRPDAAALVLGRTVRCLSSLFFKIKITRTASLTSTVKSSLSLNLDNNGLKWLWWHYKETLACRWLNWPLLSFDNSCTNRDKAVWGQRGCNLKRCLYRNLILNLNGFYIFFKELQLINILIFCKPWR